MAKELSVNSEKGKKFLAYELLASEMYMQKNPGVTYIHTPKKQAAEVDAILTRGNEIIQVVEMKSREFDLALLFGPYNGEWLITHDKILRSMKAAKAMKVGLTFFLYSIYDETLLVQPIADREGLLLVEYKVRASTTYKDLYKQEVKTENNAYINMRRAKFLQNLPPEQAAQDVLTLTSLIPERDSNEND